MNDIKVIVPGGLNTDIVGYGVKKLLGAGELTLGGRLTIGPGGKARNMAQMAAVYLGRGRVAMIGRSSRDPNGLWKVPLAALEEAGVDTSHVRVLGFEESGGKYPGVALIPVDRRGRNQIYVLPGVNEDFSSHDIENAEALFKNPNRDKILILALEIPQPTAKHCLEKAVKSRIRVILDPGGIDVPLDDAFFRNTFLIKPNAYEAEILTGVKIMDFFTAEKASRALRARGVQNVLITHGDKGAYFFNREDKIHIPCPEVTNTGIRDETGCGDQVTAILAACLAEDMGLAEAAKKAVHAGTLQFCRTGVQPIQREEL
ncbi:MAG: PfkB family carbohydrate kinase [Candidatus Aminicenantes bacterium]|jgi:ribokinase